MTENVNVTVNVPQPAPPPDESVEDIDNDPVADEPVEGDE